MIVAAYNEADVLAAKLENTWQLDYPAARFRLIIGSDGSSDASEAILKQCADLRLRFVCFPARRGKISVLNDLMRDMNAGSETEIVVMSDANTMFAPDALKLMMRQFVGPKNRRVGCVSGELHLAQNGGASGEGLYWRYEGWIKRCESRLGFLIGCNGGIFALRPNLYTPLPPGTLIEDFVLTLRVLEQGWQVRFVPEARGVEPPCPTSRAEMIRKIRIGAGGFQALRLTARMLHPRYGFRAFAYWGHKVLRWLVPVFFLAALGANLALSVSPAATDSTGLTGPGFFRALLALQLVGAVIALFSYAAPPQRRLPGWTKPISYFYLMNYALFCGLARYLTGKQRVTWDRASR